MDSVDVVPSFYCVKKLISVQHHCCVFEEIYVQYARGVSKYTPVYLLGSMYAQALRAKGWEKRAILVRESLFSLSPLLYEWSICHFYCCGK